MRIFLVGLPGSGKSTIGRQLSLSLKWPFIDTDEEIIKEQKCSIEEIFALHGETHFRKLEHEMLVKIITGHTHSIISTGGGTPCFYNNSEIIEDAGLSVFLNVPVPVIYKRMLNQRHHNRPMLQNKTDEEVLEFLNSKLSERISYYEKATLEFFGPDITASEVLDKLKAEKYIE